MVETQAPKTEGSDGIRWRDNQALLNMQDVGYHTEGNHELTYAAEVETATVKLERDGMEVVVILEPQEVVDQHSSRNTSYVLIGKLLGKDAETFLNSPAIVEEHLQLLKGHRGKAEEWTDLTSVHIYPMKVASQGLRIAIRGKQ